jgi:hypothetical protein
VRVGRIRRRVTAIVLSLVIGTVSCRDANLGDRDTVLARADAARLVGVWDVTFVLERSLTYLYDSAAARPVAGSMAFTENRRGEGALGAFGAVTHKGVYDVDLSSFGLTLRGHDRTGTAVARTVPMSADGDRSALLRDSVLIALDPDDSRLNLRLAGILVADSVAGSWTSDVLRSGRFVMRRRPEPYPGRSTR